MANNPSKTKKVLLVQPYFAVYRWGVLKKIVDGIDGDVKFIQFQNDRIKDLPAHIGSNLIKTSGKAKCRKFGIRWDVVSAFIKYKPDIIITAPTPETSTQILIVLMQKLLSGKVIIWHKGPSPERDQASIRAHIINFLMAITGRFINAFILYGSEAYNYFAGLGINKKKLFIAQNCIDTKEILDAKKDINIAADRIKNNEIYVGKKIILVLCTLKPSKLVDHALIMFSIMEQERDDVFLILAGDGLEKNNLLKLAKKLNLRNFTYVGRLPIFEDNYYISAAKIFLVPGGGGLSIIQAMLLSTPVVCADEIGSDTEMVIDNETGIRFPRGDVDSMHEACNRILNKPDVSIEISNKAKEKVLNESTVDIMATGILHALSFCNAPIRNTTS